jgi:hypothetical protein
MPRGDTGIGPADWFFLSRLDGRSPVRVICQLVGMTEAEGLQSSERLLRAGMVRTEASVGPSLGRRAEASPSQAASTRPVSKVEAPDASRGAVSTPPPARGRASEVPAGGEADPMEQTLSLCSERWPISFERFVFDPVEAVDHGELSARDVRVVLYMHHHLRRVSYYDLFCVAPTADVADLRAAYYRLSRAFHPDRWFRRPIGQFRTRIEDIFKWVNRAHSVLTHPTKRRGYDNILRRGWVGEWQLEDEQRATARRPATSDAAPSGTPAALSRASTDPGARRSATMLRMRARQLESQGHWTEAVDQYQRAMALEGTTELHIALIECMFRAHAQDSDIAQELQRAQLAAPRDSRVLLLRAEHARRTGRDSEARQLFEEVLALDPSNAVARMGRDRLST